MMLAFSQVNDYTTFRAEFAIDAGDIIFHFYKTPEVESGKDPKGYWMQTFPAVLVDALKSVFNSDYPRLQAKHMYDTESPYTDREPLDSWWVRAFGFGGILDPHKLTYKFLDTLDHGLDAAIQNVK